MNSIEHFAANSKQDDDELLRLQTPFRVDVQAPYFSLWLWKFQNKSSKRKIQRLLYVQHQAVSVKEGRCGQVR